MQESKEPGDEVRGQAATAKTSCEREIKDCSPSESGLNASEYLTALEVQKADEEDWKRITAQVRMRL